MPNSFGAGILNFILKNKKHTKRVIEHLGYDEEEFMKSI
jgi:hypothetical protein